MGFDSPKMQVVSREPPKQFSDAAFSNAVYAILKTDKTMAKKGRLLLQLAAIAGGPRLAAAVDFYTVAPCMGQYDCGDCWVAPYCVHRSVPAEVRAEIEQLILEIVEKDPPDDTVEILRRIDKTSPDSLEMIRMIHSQVCLE